MFQRCESKIVAMAERGFLTPSVSKFDGFYEHWSLLMENLLRSKDYWSVVENGVPPLSENATPENAKANEDAKLKDLKAKNYLFQAIERGIIETMISRSTSKEIWESMKERYQGSTKVKKAQLQALKKEYEKLQMKDSESVAEFFTRTLTLVNKMKAHG